MEVWAAGWGRGWKVKLTTGLARAELALDEALEPEPRKPL